MSYGSSNHTASVSNRPRPLRAPTTPSASCNTENGERVPSRRDSGAFDGLNKRTRRGKSPLDIMREGAISSEERSEQFEGIPIDEKEIKKLPRKVSRSHKSLTLLAW
jgi:hypothetical protein